MKKSIALLLVIVLAVSVVLTACGSSSDSDSKLIFSAYYKHARGFDEFEPLLQEIFALVQTAYNACDKEDPSTFSCDRTAFDELHLKIARIFGSFLDVKISEITDHGFDREAYDATSDAKDIYYVFYAYIANLNRDIEA